HGLRRVARQVIESRSEYRADDLLERVLDAVVRREGHGLALLVEHLQSVALRADEVHDAGDALVVDGLAWLRARIVGRVLLSTDLRREAEGGVVVLHGRGERVGAEPDRAVAERPPVPGA